MALLLPDSRDLRREARSGHRIGHTAQPAPGLQQGEELHHGGAHHLARPPEPVYAPFAAPQVTNYPPILDATRAGRLLLLHTGLSGAHLCGRVILPSLLL